MSIINELMNISKFTCLFPGVAPSTNITEAEEIFRDNDEFWMVNPNPSFGVNQNSELSIQLQIDLGVYHFFDGIKIHNGNPGVKTFSLSRQLFEQSQDTTLLIEETSIDNGQILEKKISDINHQFARYLILKVTPGFEASEIKYLDILFMDSPFLIKHKETNKYLSIGPKDSLLYVHDLSCRTQEHIYWNCFHGQLENSNGKIVRLMNPTTWQEMKSRDDDLQMIEAHFSTNNGQDPHLIPSVRDEATIASSEVDFSDDVLSITVKNQKYYLNFHEFPQLSYFLKHTTPPRDTKNLLSREYKGRYSFSFHYFIFL